MAASSPRPRRVSVRLAAALAYITAIFLGAMDAQIVNVALPTLSRQFKAPLSSVQWVAVAYVLALAILIPASGWISDKIGTKRTFLIALALFTLTSILCSQAQNLVELIAARAIQGAGAGMLAPAATSMMLRAYPPAERARLSRLVILPIIIGPASAPLIGGLLISALSWRWIFYVNVPVGIAALIFSKIYLVEHRESAHSRFDLLGFLLSGGGLCLSLYALGQGPQIGWSSPRVIITGLLGASCLLAFIPLELRRRDNPLIHLRLLRNRLFRSTNVVMACAIASFLGILYLTPIFLQEARHQSALSAGLTTFVEAFGILFGTQVIGLLYPRVGPRRLAIVGMTVLAASVVAIGFVTADTNLWLIRLAMFVAGVFNGFATLGVQTAMFAKISSRDTSHAAAIFSVFRQVSLALGIALLSTIVSSVHGSKFTAFHDAFFAAAAVALAGAITAAALLHDTDARETMVRPKRDLEVASFEG